MPQTTAANPRRKWFRFSLRTLLIVIVLLSLPFAWLSVKIRKAERQRQAVEAISKAGGVVLYDYELKAMANQIAELGAEFPGIEINALGPKPEPPAPEWLRGLLGVDFFSDVVGVDITRTHATKEGIEELRKALPNCEILHARTPEDQP